jgi:hypothetical protein
MTALVREAVLAVLREVMEVEVKKPFNTTRGRSFSVATAVSW